MRIGVLTLHSGFNEGAMLQAYALVKNLRRHVPEAEVEVVDHRYRTKTLTVYGDADNARERALTTFMEQSLPLSSARFFTDDHRPTFEYLNDAYDAVVVGSDEVWKLHYQWRFKGLWPVQNDPWKPPFPNVYWPDTSVRCIKIAYAASIGKLNWKQIPRWHVTEMRRILQDFALLGVRDDRALEFLQWLLPEGAARAEWVPDPTFAVDLIDEADADALRERLEGYGVDFSRPRLGLVLQEAPHTSESILQFKKAGYQIVSLSTKNDLADVALHDKGFTPLEWVRLFGFFDRCITQRMHGCIACLLNNTPFIGVDYHRTVDGMTKIKDLLSRFGLLAYYHYAPDKNAAAFMQACDKLKGAEWPEVHVADQRLQFRKRAEEYSVKIRQVLPVFA